MFTAQQYRARAGEYATLLETARSPAECSEYRDLQRTFASLADNLDWVTLNAAKTVSCPTNDHPAAVREDPHAEEVEEAGILRCLGAAVILNWNTIPAKLQRALFEGAIGIQDELGAPSKGVLAQFLHDHKNDARRALPGGLALHATPDHSQIAPRERFIEQRTFS